MNTKRFVTPPNESTLVWVRWHTPATPQEMTVQVSSTHGNVVTPTVICEVGELTEATPPDSRGPDLPSPHFVVPREPLDSGIKKATWGEWVDNGNWEYDWEEYSAALRLTTEVIPAQEVLTEKWNYGCGKWEMKSGYGVNINVEARVETDANASDVTCAQNTIAQFPEFDYEDYFRILQPTPNGLTTSFALRFNKYSYKGASVHYTPIWFPDDSRYAPKVTVFDVWTPAGQLHYTGTDFVFIDGDVYDDWNVSPVEDDERWTE